MLSFDAELKIIRQKIKNHRKYLWSFSYVKLLDIILPAFQPSEFLILSNIRRYFV